jgi:hypothetical protein
MNRIAAAIASLAWLTCLHAAASPLRADHPLLGTWDFKLPGSGCVDSMTVLRSGKVTSTSAQEIGESDAEISDKPNDRGLYKWVDKMTASNGKPDCGDSVTPIGDVAVNFIRLDASGDRFMLCLGEAADPCLGPYVRRRLPR